MGTPPGCFHTVAGSVEPPSEAMEVMETESPQGNRQNCVLLTAVDQLCWAVAFLSSSELKVLFRESRSGVAQVSPTVVSLRWASCSAHTGVWGSSETGAAAVVIS